MRRTKAILALWAGSMLAWTAPVAGIDDGEVRSEGRSATRHVDAADDATGMAPDILAVTIDGRTDSPLVGISVEFASEPALRTDGDTWTDAVFIFLTSDPALDGDGCAVGLASRTDVRSDFAIGAHGVTLGTLVEEGGHLAVGDGTDLYWLVVDVAVDGPIVTWRLDRKLLGDPDALAVQVLAGVEHEDPSADGYDSFPDDGERLVVASLGGEPHERCPSA